MPLPLSRSSSFEGWPLRATIDNYGLIYEYSGHTNPKPKPSSPSLCNSGCLAIEVLGVDRYSLLSGIDNYVSNLFQEDL